MCNDYVPNNSVYTRFLYVVGYFVRQGFYVLIDNHSNTDPTVVNNPAVRPPAPDLVAMTQVFTLLDLSASRLGRLCLLPCWLLMLLTEVAHSVRGGHCLSAMQTWLAQWTQLMMDITSDPVSKAMVMVDILNEPDSRGLTCGAPPLLGSLCPCMQHRSLLFISLSLF